MNQRRYSTSDIAYISNTLTVKLGSRSEQTIKSTFSKMQQNLHILRQHKERKILTEWVTRFILFIIIYVTINTSLRKRQTNASRSWCTGGTGDDSFLITEKDWGRNLYYALSYWQPNNRYRLNSLGVYVKRVITILYLAVYMLFMYVFLETFFVFLLLPLNIHVTHGVSLRWISRCAYNNYTILLGVYKMRS